MVTRGYKKLLSVTLYCLLSTLYFFSGCGKESVPLPSNTPTLTDATGVAVSLIPPPSRIISFAPSITKNIYLLGEGRRLMGVTRYCKVPPGEVKQVIGNLSEQDIEQVMKLAPDLVIATKEGNKPEMIDQLRRFGIRVFVLSEATSWADVQKDFSQMATLLGETKEAEQILARLQQRLDKISRGKPAGRQQKKVFVQLSEQLHTIGKDTYIDEAISYAGGVNIARETLNRWAMLSIEKVIREDPDLIIITGMGEMTEVLKTNWQKFQTLKAVKNNKVCVIDNDICCQPTPENFVRLVEMIREKLQ